MPACKNCHVRFILSYSGRAYVKVELLKCPGCGCSLTKTSGISKMRPIYGRVIGGRIVWSTTDISSRGVLVKATDYAFRAADVITQAFRLSWNPVDIFVGLNVVRSQHAFFPAGSYIWSTHCYISLGNGLLTECTFPHTRTVPVTELHSHTYHVYRYRHYDFAADLGAVTYLNALAERYKGTDYDWLHLMGYLVEEVAGVGNSEAENMCCQIGIGKEKLVCSTYVNVLYRKLRGYVDDVSMRKLPKLFGGLPVELTMPAHYDNTPADYEQVAVLS
jgi:hypothetical protein